MSCYKVLIILISSCLLLTLFIGCSNHPTEKWARADLQNWLKNRWPGEVAIVEFANTGVAGDDGKYTVRYRAKARFLQNEQGCMTTCCGDVCIDKLFHGKFRWEIKASPDPRVIRKGDMFLIDGEITYRKTEFGWAREVFSF